ncbi:Zinc finger, RING-type [Dillenia turbinata]|uniref:RING-type E3 ubiquitin transferase n=1 Tax=Dillenia turbinata TaxID=194707 RepID=A0AAN8ZJ85_9MAGN
MEMDLPNTSLDLTQSRLFANISGDVVVDHSNLEETCSLCQIILSPDNESTGDLQNIALCGYCKLLLLDDHGTPVQSSHQRRQSRRRRTRYGSTESLEDLFSQQFSHMINLVRQNQLPASEHEDHPADANAESGATRLLQHSSSRSTPSGSRRWRRVLSDNESDVDNFDSLFGETESNISLGGDRAFHTESDAISFSVYAGDSDASVDGYSALETEMFVQPGDESELDTDTDIDPMHAGQSHWYSDGQEEDEDGEWEEADAEENTAISTVGTQHQNLAYSSPRESNGFRNFYQVFDSLEIDSTTQWTVQGTRDLNVQHNMEDLEVGFYRGGNRDYLDARGFEELLEHLAGNDNSRRGAPPAALSSVNNLPRVIIANEDERHVDLTCAICKDTLSVGTEVNQLPCFHLYHPPCILRWLTSRNSCPLCRYELPTDDRDYEEAKHHTSHTVEIERSQHQDVSYSSSDISEQAEMNEAGEFSHIRPQQEEQGNMDGQARGHDSESTRRRWLFITAAPIVSLMGVALVLWLGNPVMERRGSTDSVERRQHQPNQRDSRGRRWWSLF